MGPRPPPTRGPPPAAHRGRVAPRAGLSRGLRGQATTQPAVHFYAAAPVHFYAAVDIVYRDRQITFYCRCFYDHKGRSGGVIDWSDCDYKPRLKADGTVPKSASTLDWEHVVPASRIASHRACWQQPAPALCQEKNKKTRKCCEHRGVDDWARHAINDLHNLTPSVGQVNRTRSNHPHGIVELEPRQFGMCDFEVENDTAEPDEFIRGNIARIWFYMVATYGAPSGEAGGLSLTADQRELFEGWSGKDPVGAWERERDLRINEIQGNSNPFVQ